MKHKKIIYLIAILALLIPANCMAATKSMTAYRRIIKQGNTVYCNSGIALYKVNVKTGKKTVILDLKNGAGDVSLKNMKKHGRWIYYIEEDPASSTLHRVNIKTKKHQKIASKKVHKEDICVTKYVISGSKIYFKGIYNSGGSFNKVMKLNGKGKEKTKVNIRMKSKPSNARRYKIVRKKLVSGEGYKSYLKSPRKTYYLGTSEW